MGGIISGVTQFATAGLELTADQQAADLKYKRDIQAADLAIESAREQGAWESGKARILGEKLAREQQMAYANSGIDSTTGTAAQVQANTAALSAMDAQQLAIRAAREVYGLQEGKKQAKENRDIARAAAERKAIGQGLGGMAKTVGGLASWGTG